MRDTDVVVIGLATGSAICLELAQNGHSVIGLDCGHSHTSTARNQKWKHSGALFLQESLAARLWEHFCEPHVMERPHIEYTGAWFVEASEILEQEYIPLWSKIGIPFRRVGTVESPCYSCRRHKTAVNSALLPDAVIKFESVVRDTVNAARSCGAMLLERSNIRGIDVVERCVIVRFEVNCEVVSVKCNHLVVAAGAWTNHLAGLMGIELPLNNTKSHILEYKARLVDRIVVFLDEPQFTLVPFAGHTLVSNALRQNAVDPFDRNADRTIVESMANSFRERLTQLTGSDSEPEMIARACIKTERSEDGQCFAGSSTFDHSHHGLHRVTFVVPGKASLMFAVAKEVRKCVAATIRK